MLLQCQLDEVQGPGRSRKAVSAKKICKAMNFTTDENVSMKSRPSTYKKPWAIIQALNFRWFS